MTCEKVDVQNSVVTCKLQKYRNVLKKNYMQGYGDRVRESGDFSQFALLQMRIRGRNVFMGYLNQPETTKQAFDKEGWFITGDLARRDEDGFLYFIGKPQV